MFLKIKIIIIILLLLLISCTISQRKSKNEIDKRDTITNNFEIQFLDSATFENYIFIGLLDSKERSFYLISKRINTINYVDSAYYEVMKTGEKYRINIIKQDSIITMKTKTAYKLDEYTNLENNIIIWSKDTIRTIVYMSPNVINKYIKIIE